MAPGVRGGESLDEKFAQGFKIHSYRPAGKGPLKKCYGLQSLFHHKRYFHHCKASFFITGIFYLCKHSLSLLQTLFHQYLFYHSITASTLFITTSVFSSLQALFFIATSTLFIITSTRIITSTLFLSLQALISSPKAPFLSLQTLFFNHCKHLFYHYKHALAIITLFPHRRRFTINDFTSGAKKKMKKIVH